jgi:DNA-binding NtrC family response regulator
VAPPTASPPPEAGWSETVRTFKRQLLEQTLERTHGNRTHAARALGLQRTYLLRLINDLEAQAPPVRPGRGIAMRSTSPATR